MSGTLSERVEKLPKWAQIEFRIMGETMMGMLEELRQYKEREAIGVPREMADIIAQHATYATWDEEGEEGEEWDWYVGCAGCDWQRELIDDPATDSANHVANELKKAGYGMRVAPLPLTEG